MDIINPQAQQTPQAQTTPEPQQQPVQPPAGDKVRRTSKVRSVFRIVLILIIATLAAGGVYFWQQGKASELKSQLDAKIAENTTLQQQANSDSDKPANTVDSGTQTPTGTPTTTVSEDLIAGNVDTNRTDGRVMIGTIFKYSLNPSAVWVEYGLSPTKLDRASEKLTKGLGAGDPNSVYATGFDVFLTNSQLTPGTNYYYRTAATVGGKTLYSGVASFVTIK